MPRFTDRASLNALVEPHDAPLVASILIGRAASALKMGMCLRALTDTEAALALGGGRRAAFVRALALISIGACETAIAVLAPFRAADRQLPPPRRRRHLSLALLSAAADARARRVVARIAALGDAPNSSTPIPPQCAYIHGGLSMRRIGSSKGRGWVATTPIRAGTLLIVEPASAGFPTVGPQTETTEESTLPLLKAVAHALSDNNPLGRNAMLEFLSCLHPLDGEADAVPMLRDQLAKPFVEGIGRGAGLSSDDAKVWI